ncbi:MAG TPA: LacI family DNA-binding transcriptional regulator [Kofleriaceae bacterium]|nr:LacI family DNA-binding transcriptional regulator [Kofleriaceae bacterium]
MKRVVRLTDVAQAAGVSKGTASNVFNRPEVVRPEVRTRVQEAARRLGYGGPDPRGRLLRAGKVNAIGIVIADQLSYFFCDPFARLLMSGIAEVCDQHGAGISLVSGASGEQAAWSIETALVDGFIVHCLEQGDRLIEHTRRRNLPFVSIDLDAGAGTSSVLIDDRQGAYLAARHLLELGHRSLAIMSLELRSDGRFGWADPERLGSSTCRVERDRMAGYAAALAEHGLDIERIPVMEAPNDLIRAAPHADQLLAGPDEITGVLCMSDVLALAVIEAARRRERRVPDDLSVVGFDDIPEAAAATPPLTTIAQPIADKGRRAAALIFEEAEPRSEVLPVRFVERGSTARPPAGAART